MIYFHRIRGQAFLFPSSVEWSAEQNTVSSQMQFLGEITEGERERELEDSEQVYFRLGEAAYLGICTSKPGPNRHTWVKMDPSTLKCTLPGLFGERHFHTHTGRKSEHCRSLFDDCCCTPFFLTNKYFENIFAFRFIFFLVKWMRDTILLHKKLVH